MFLDSQYIFDHKEFKHVMLRLNESISPLAIEYNANYKYFTMFNLFLGEN